MDRRKFVRLAASTGGALLSAPILEEAVAASTHSTAAASAAFWTSQVRTPSKAMTLQAAREHMSSSTANTSREPVFLYYDDTKKALIDSGDITPTIKTGDVDVVVRVLRFRPSTDDVEQFNKIKSGSLRIDLQQQQVSPDVGEKMAWSAIAALLPGGNGKLPDLSSLKFDPGTAWGQLSKVPLPGGQGFWTWNFFLQKKDTIWGQIISAVHGAIQGGAPAGFFSLLGLPAIAVTALDEVDKLLSYFSSKADSEYLFQSTNKPVVATQDAVTAVGPDTIHLTTGTYLIVPESHAGSVDTSYEISNEGLYVPQNTDSTKQYDVAANTKPDVTYLTAYVKVTPKTGGA